MLPLSDGIPARRFPIVTIAIILANFAVWKGSRVLGLIVIFPVRVSAWFFLGFWFLYQLYEANVGIFSSEANGGGVAFFAHVGGFVFGVLVARLYASSGRLNTTDQPPVGMPV